MPYVIEVGLGLLKLKQEALRLIILDGFGNPFTHNSKSPSFSCTGGNRSSLYFIILLLREREYGEADDIVIMVVTHLVFES